MAYHGDSWIPECLRSLAEHRGARDQLLLVDNSGNKELDRIDLSGFDAEWMKTEKPQGFAAANNFALVYARRLNEFVVFLNQDTLTCDSWLDACIECLQSNPEIAAVTPITRTYDWQGWDPYFLECANKSEAFSADFKRGGELAKFYETPVIPAAAMVVRRSVLEEVGPFDPVYGSYYEDYDLCHRMRAAGYKVGVCTRGCVAHFSGSTSSTRQAQWRRARWVTRNRVILSQRQVKEQRWLALLKHFLLVFPRGVARSLLRRSGSKPLWPYLQAHWDLLLLAPRLLSRRRDIAGWNRYLASIGWPPHPSRGI